MDPELVKFVGESMARDLVSIFGPSAHHFLPIPLDSEPIDSSESDDDEPKSRRLINQPSSTMSHYGSRDGRRERANFFLKFDARHHVHYPVIKACTSAGINHVWSDTWLGITWVALQGTNSLCVVVRNNDLLHLKRELLKSGDSDTYALEAFHRLFWNFIVSEVEGIEEKVFDSSSMRPFSVVTVGAIDEGSISGHEDAEGAIFCAEQTCMFLREKLKSDPSLSSEKTIQTAIMVTQHLFGREFEADEIRVFVWDQNKIIGKELPQKRENPNLEELFASLDESDNDDPDTRSFKSRRLGASRSHASLTPPGEF